MKSCEPRYGYQVYLSDKGYVCIEQQGDGPTTVLFRPDEIPALIRELDEMRREAEKPQAD